jgi:hypothetical protein
MGKLTVRFVGLCTHIRFAEISNDPLLPPHRVVLVVADEDVLLGHQVGKHEPVLIRPHQRPDDVRGQRVRVSNAVPGTAVTYDATFLEGPTCVPSLRALTPGLTNDDLDPHVVKEGDEAAAQFDVTRGCFRAQRDETSGAISTWVEIETDGPPELVIESLPDGEEIGSLPLEGDEVEISFGNRDVDSARESRDDFFWHYKILKEMPHDPGRPNPTNRSFRPTKTFDVEINGPGCSNSTWP